MNITKGMLLSLIFLLGNSCSSHSDLYEHLKVKDLPNLNLEINIAHRDERYGSYIVINNEYAICNVCGKKAEFLCLDSGILYCFCEDHKPSAVLRNV